MELPLPPPLSIGIGMGFGPRGGEGEAFAVREVTSSVSLLRKRQKLRASYESCETCASRPWKSSIWSNPPSSATPWVSTGCVDDLHIESNRTWATTTGINGPNG